MKPIMSFQDKQYRFLSNFFKFACPVTFNNIAFVTTEAAYVAAKTTSQHLQRAIADMTPGKAKKFGAIIVQEKLWPNPKMNDAFKIVLMKDLVLQKFTKNVHLRLALLDTDHRELIEGNHWHDNFFGVCSCGNCPIEKQRPVAEQNHLGRILMQVREELRNK